jgi:hypothetical protein
VFYSAITDKDTFFLQAGIPARTTPKSESRGRDGRGFSGPGLDHGVFVPFRLMFGEEFLDVPIVQASIDSSLSPEKNWAIGKAVTQLRSVRGYHFSRKINIVINKNQKKRRVSLLFPVDSLSTTCVIGFPWQKATPARSTRNLTRLSCPQLVLQMYATPFLLSFRYVAQNTRQPAARKTALVKLTSHPGFRASHPREEHFVPLYVAAGAGEDGGVEIVSAVYGAPTVAFGL